MRMEDAMPRNNAREAALAQTRSNIAAMTGLSAHELAHLNAEADALTDALRDDDSPEDLAALIAAEEAAGAKEAAERRAASAAEADKAARAAAEAARPAREREERLGFLRRRKDAAEARIKADAVAAAHDAAEAALPAVMAAADAAREVASFTNATPDFAAVAARQLSDIFGVTVSPLVFTKSGDAGVVNAKLWGLEFTGRVSRDLRADVWTCDLVASTRRPDGSIGHMGDVTSPLDLSLLLSGTPRLRV